MSSKVIMDNSCLRDSFIVPSVKKSYQAVAPKEDHKNTFTIIATTHVTIGLGQIKLMNI